MSVKQALRWFDDHILILLASFLLAFIPLWPKIPLWSPIEQYIVRVRAEDFAILLTFIVWGIQVLRRKARWWSPMIVFILAYAVVGLASSLIAIFVIKTVPEQILHIGKTFLHYFRYLEYFSMFGILFSAVRTRKQVLMAFSVVIATVLVIAVYGYGQRYFFWPVYSTMNREFSKGIPLYLTQYARVQSTFGGHYDMAAYLVLTLPLVLAAAYRTQRRWASTAMHIIFWIGTWLLILSASRAPFAAYLVGVALVLFITAYYRPSWKQKIGFLISRGTVLALFTGVLFYYFGSDLTERLSQLISNSPALSQTINKLQDGRRVIISDQAIAQLPLSPTQLQKILPKGSPPNNGISTDDVSAVAAIAAATKDVASKSDQPPTPIKDPNPSASPTPTPTPVVLPAGVYEDIPDVVTVATVSAKGEIVYQKVLRPRVFSQCALEKELSLCIRQETLWPRAIEGFLTNPWTGSGYATLTKETVGQFTEADSTDNNFLRTLGETGLLGFVTFYGCVALVIFYGFKNMAHPDKLKSAMATGMLAGSVGLLLNAVYIDVFAASKVAQTYWGLSGLFLGFVFLDQTKRPKFELAKANSTLSQKAKKKAISRTRKTETKRS